MVQQTLTSFETTKTAETDLTLQSVILQKSDVVLFWQQIFFIPLDTRTATIRKFREYCTSTYEKKVQRASLGGQFRQKLPELALCVFSYLYCACIHQEAVLGALEHLHLDSCFLKCVDKLKDCQDTYLQKHYCVHILPI